MDCIRISRGRVCHVMPRGYSRVVTNLASENKIMISLYGSKYHEATSSRVLLIGVSSDIGISNNL